MTTKTLRISGGDFSTLDATHAYISSVITGGIADDIKILVQGGQTFGPFSYGTTYGTSKLNGYSIIFQTEPTEKSTPPILNYSYWGPFGQAPDGTPNTGYFKFVDLTVIHSAVGGGYAFSLGGRSDGVGVWLENCKVYANLHYGSVVSFIEGFSQTTPAVHRIDNCSIFLSSIIGFGKLRIFNTQMGTVSTSSRITNTLIVLNNGNYDAGFQAASVSVISDSNVVFNSQPGYSITTIGSHLNLITNTDPHLVDNVVQSNLDTAATMQARNAYLTSLSTACLNNANVTYLPATDINGTVRPQGISGDRGAYEFIVPPVPPTIYPVGGGSYTNSVWVSIENTVPNTTIYYSYDGSAPTISASAIYTKEFELSTTAIVKSIAVLSGTSSEVISAGFTITEDHSYFPAMRDGVNIPVATKKDHWAWGLSQKCLTKVDIVDEDVINESIVNILSCVPGERIFNASFGSPLMLQVFDNLIDGTAQNLLSNLISVLGFWEDRATFLLNQSSLFLDPDNNALDLTITYQINKSKIQAEFKKKILF